MDLDKGGRGFQQVKTWLGPSLGWVMEQVKASTTITVGGTYTVQPGDSLILVNTTGLVTINLPDVRSWVQQTASQPATGFERAILIKDLGGNAAVFNVTIAPFGGQNIDNTNAPVFIAESKGVVGLIPLIDLSGWVAITGSGGMGIPPVLSLPTDTTIGSGTGAIGVTTNVGAGTLFWVVTTSSTAPSATQIKNGLDNVGAPAAAHGSQPITAVGVQSATASGLVDFTAYTAHFVQTVGPTTSNTQSGNGFTPIPMLADFVGTILAGYNMIQNGGRRFNTTDVDVNGQSVWTVDSGSFATTAIVGPDQTTLAYKFVEGAGFGGWRARTTAVFDSGASPANGTYQFLLIAKLDGRTRILLKMTAGGGFDCDALFDLAGGNTGFNNTSTGGGGWAVPTSSMTQIGSSGWWICKMTGTILSSVALAVGVEMFIDNGAGTAARSVSYTGDSTSGILLWFASLMPSGAEAVATTVFFDDFSTLNTIDLNDTGAPGFNWYPHNRWPVGPSTNWTVANISPADTFSVANSILTIGKGANAGLNLDLSTARVNPTNNNAFIGTVFQAPYLIEGRFAWNVNDATEWNRFTSTHTDGFNGGSPTFWALDIDTLIATPVTGTGYAQNPRSMEIDYFEAFSAFGAIPAVKVGGAILDYSYLIALTGTVSWAAPQPATITDFHNFATLVMPPSGGHNGIVMSFRDGIYTPRYAVVPTSSTFSSFSQARMPIHLSGGSGVTMVANVATGPHNAPLYVDWIRVRKP